MSTKHEEKTVVALSTGGVTSSLKCPPSDRNRHSAIIDNLKNGCKFQTVHAGQVVCIEH
jgi:hypothetical protein